MNTVRVYALPGTSKDFTCAADGHTIAANETLYEFYAECPPSLRYAQHNKGRMYCANHVHQHVDVTRWADQAACDAGTGKATT